MDTLAKIYDVMLLNRLKLYCSIDKCQAGAQKNRDCVEQTMTLRLLCDSALFEKRIFYVLFIDFSKAYDRVPRMKLIERLRALGCSNVMLHAILAMHKSTKNIPNSAVGDVSIGVRQGAPSSCLLYVIYINEMVKMLKRTIASDGFLGRLHTLLMMYDALILSTSREMNVFKKLEVVYRIGRESSMVIDEKKTCLFAINGEDCD